MIDTAFAKTLKRLRSTKKLSQEDLGHQAGLHRTYISQLERGLKSPSLRTMYQLTQILEISLAEWMDLVQKELDK